MRWRGDDPGSDLGLWHPWKEAGKIQNKLVGAVADQHKVRVDPFGFLFGKLDIDGIVPFGIHWSDHRGLNLDPGSPSDTLQARWPPIRSVGSYPAGHEKGTHHNAISAACSPCTS